MNKSRLHIVGLGLIGGSMAMGLREADYGITGWDRDPERLKEAREREIIDGVIEPGDELEGTDGIILAVPVPSMVSVTGKYVSGTSDLQFVTDVGSTKDWIVGEMEKVLPESVEFVGGHPMAGSEQSGLKVADPLLFENAICVITATNGNTGSVQSVRSMWKDLGALIMELSPGEHDQLAARISHLPHLVASGLLHSISTEDIPADKALALAAGGFRDTTRIAEGDPELWRDIFETNQERIIEVVDQFRRVLDGIRDSIAGEDWEKVTEWLDQARNIRRDIPEKAKGMVGTLYELRLQAPDKPGTLARITGLLKEAEINICDIEVLRVREGEMGTVKVAFRREEELEEARHVLRNSDSDIDVM
ncbi:MAG: prephenate dehydrogenase/arogenate dehydrogenase family protein [bacterium]